MIFTIASKVCVIGHRLWLEPVRVSVSNKKKKKLSVCSVEAELMNNNVSTKALRGRTGF